MSLATSGSTAFWRSAYSVDLDAMKLLVEYGADPNIATMAPPAPIRRAGPNGQPAGAGGAITPTAREGQERYTAPPIPPGGPGAMPIHAAAGVEYGEGFAGNAHRHAPEVKACAKAASGVDAHLAFVPHSGPFARGIHVTVQAVLAKPATQPELLEAITKFYAHSPFVSVSGSPPRIKDVAGSNYARLAVASDGNTVAVMSVLDNLNKGAAGGGVQWMNRLLGLPETAGLTAPAAGWT